MGNKTLRAVVILVGTTIGAGIFGIPYTVSRLGFIPGIAYLLVLGGIVLLLNLIYGEVILRTPGDHQLTGYGQIYLGKPGKFIASVAMFISLYGALLAYLIKIGEFLALIFNFPDSLIFSLIFFVLAVTAISFGLRAISQIELILVALIIAFIGVVGVVGVGQINLLNLQMVNLSFTTLALPYGVMLFALTGSASVPEMEEVLRNSPKKLKNAVIYGSLIPLFTYLIFTLVIVGICGLLTSDDAISGLVNFLPQWSIKLGASLGVLTMGTSFLTLGYVLREIWYRDYQLPKIASLTLACLPPLLFFLVGTKNFIYVLEITGALTGGLSGIIIIILYNKAQKIGQKKPAYQLKIPTAILWLLGIIFGLGMFSPFFL